MNKKELVLACLEGQYVHPRPVGAVTQSATVELMEATGAKWPEAHRDAEKMAALAGGAYEIFNFDLVRVPFDQTIEAELFGCPVSPGSLQENCSVKGAVAKIGEAIPPVPNPESGGAQAVIRAISLLRKRTGDEVAVLGGVVGPFTVAGHLLGITQILLNSVTHPTGLLPFLVMAGKFAAEYALRQVQAGADAIVVEDMAASLELTSPRIYDEIILPHQKRLIESIPAPVILHICGNNTPILSKLAETGAQALSLDAKTDLNAAVEATKGRCAVIGGVPPVDALLNGDPSLVREKSRESLSAGVHLLAPGCGIPPKTPTANLLAMAEAAREWEN